MVTPGGFEPSTNCLRGNCSAVELRSHVIYVDVIELVGQTRARYYTAKEFDVNKDVFQPSSIIIVMIELTIPGRGELRIHHLVTDVNGTLAVDGQLLDGLVKRIFTLRDRITFRMITADTHGRQSNIDQQLGLAAVRLDPVNEAAQKAEYVRSLGADTVVAIGQGANDAAMLKEAALGICVLSKEGTAIETFLESDIVVPDIFTAFDLIEKPLRILATLRK